ncbi:serine hydrolase, partial [Bacillus cereus]
LISTFYITYFDFTERSAGNPTVATLIFISMLLTGFGIYDRFGEMIISEGFGYRNLETKSPVTPRTLFAIGSSTKAFGTLSLSL